MIKVNGEIDTYEEADKIVKHVLLDSLIKYHETTVSNDELKDLNKYV